MAVIKAPHKFMDAPRPWVFLAGSIEMGKAVDWQTRVGKELGESCTVLNPRRDDWDSSWGQSIENQQFREQVEWELAAQENANLILCHFEPEARAPVTMLEFGLFKNRMIVHCPEGFWRKGNVDIVCDRYTVPIAGSIDAMITYAKDVLKGPLGTYLKPPLR